jgi:ribosomal protein S18 acetylase RimI-like enzyme
VAAAVLDVRPRRPEDLAACVALAAEVHRVDGYPSFLGDGGLDRFVDPEDAMATWVATLDGDVVGNVALRPRSAPPSVAAAELALGVGADQLGFVARLMVAPRARRRGIARRLLDTVEGAARHRGLVPVLDVVTRDVAAVALYRASGWQDLGEHTFTMRNGDPLVLRVFVKP